MLGTGTQTSVLNTPAPQLVVVLAQSLWWVFVQNRVLVLDEDDYGKANVFGITPPFSNRTFVLYAGSAAGAGGVRLLLFVCCTVLLSSPVFNKGTACRTRLVDKRLEQVWQDILRQYVWSRRHEGSDPWWRLCLLFPILMAVFGAVFRLILEPSRKDFW